MHANTLLRATFCISLLLFVLAILSPQVYIRYGIIPRYPGYDWDEFHYSFQATRFPAGTYGWDFYFSPHQSLVLGDFWFSRDILYHGLTFGWIHLFILQISTAFSGLYVLVWRWKEINYLLIPLSFSTLSIIAGFELVFTYGAIWTGYTGPAWGLPLAVLSTLLLFGIFLVRHLVAKRHACVQRISHLNAYARTKLFQDAIRIRR